MTRSLTQKEHQIFTTFQQKLVLKETKTNSFSLIKENRHFNCVSPVVYKIENTDAYLVFGHLQGGYDIRRIQEELMNMQRQNKVNGCHDAECKDTACQIETGEKECRDMTCEDAECTKKHDEGENPKCIDITCQENEVVTEQTVTENNVTIDHAKIKREDVNTLIDQTGCTEGEAIKALAECDYDSIEAIIKLSETKQNK